MRVNSSISMEEEHTFGGNPRREPLFKEKSTHPTRESNPDNRGVFPRNSQKHCLQHLSLVRTRCGGVVSADVKDGRSVFF